MSLYRLSIASALFACAACSSSSSTASPGDDSGVVSDTRDSRDTSDASEPRDGDAEVGHCCVPDPSPGCCMHYGGWTSSPDEDAFACSESCDGMPNPSDPAWHLVKDDHGCDVWSSQGAKGPTCGAPIDSGVDTASDADAPSCPTSLPTRLSPCTTIDQVCFYACGTVMRCTPSGWDYDTSIDGGPPCP